MGERDLARLLTIDELTEIVLEKSGKLLKQKSSYVKIVVPTSKASLETVSQLVGRISNYYVISVLGCNLCEDHKEKPLPSVVFVANSLEAIQAARKKYFPILESEGYNIRMLGQLTLIV